MKETSSFHQFISQMPASAWASQANPGTQNSIDVFPRGWQDANNLDIACCLLDTLIRNLIEHEATCYGIQATKTVSTEFTNSHFQWAFHGNLLISLHNVHPFEMLPFNIRRNITVNHFSAQLLFIAVAYIPSKLGGFLVFLFTLLIWWSIKHFYCKMFFTVSLKYIISKNKERRGVRGRKFVRERERKEGQEVIILMMRIKVRVGMIVLCCLVNRFWTLVVCHLLSLPLYMDDMTSFLHSF